MSHTKCRVPKYGLHKPTGQARVVLDGCTYYLGRYGTEESHTQYQQVITAWIANHRTPPSRGTTTHDLTVCELLLAYLRFAEGYYVKNGKVTSEYSCLKLAVRPLEEMYGQTAIAEFGPRQLKAVRERMIAANLSRNVINKHIGRIKRVCKWGVENELLPGNVSHALSAISGLRRGRSSARETEPVKPVSDEHVDAIKPFVSPQIWGIIQLQRLTGMRPGEARTIRGCDIDMSGKLWEYAPASHKTEHHDRIRVIPLGVKAQAVLRPFLKPDLAAFVFSPRDAEAARSAERRRRRKTPFTPSQRARKPKTRRLNEFYSKDAYISAVRRACSKAGVPPWHPNQLRHSSGTRIRKEFGLEAAQVWLGHSEADVTQVYAERNLQLARKIAAKLG